MTQQPLCDREGSDGPNVGTLKLTHPGLSNTHPELFIWKYVDTKVKDDHYMGDTI